MGPAAAPTCDWDGGPGGALKTSPGGQVAVRWQGILVGVPNGPCEWRFRSSGPDWSSGQISVQTPRKIDKDVKNARRQTRRHFEVSVSKRATLYVRTHS